MLYKKQKILKIRLFNFKLAFILNFWRKILHLRKVGLDRDNKTQKLNDFDVIM